MSAAIGGSGISTSTTGLFVDVRDFGAQAVPNFNNTPAFQAAVDYVISKGGGTVYIPGSGQFPNYYFLEKPVHVNGDRVSIVGEGRHSTTLWTWGPAFIFGKHPTTWQSSVSYTDTDTGLTVAARDAQNNFILDGRYRTDLFRFRPLGDLKAGASGVPPLEWNINSLGAAYGIRPRGMVKGVFFGNPLATGTNIGWESQSQATFDFIYYAHDRPVEGGIAGMGESTTPDPWLFSGSTTQLEFAMTVTDDSLINKGVIRLLIPQPQTKGLHRVSIQVDWVNKQFLVFVDRVQVSFTINFTSGILATELFTKFNSFARWEYSDFSIGSRSRSTRYNDDSAVAKSDYTVIATKVWSCLRYVNSTVGTAQTKIDGTPLTDNDVFTAFKSQDLARLYIVDGTGIDLGAMTDNNDRCYGMLAPVGNGPVAISDCRLADLTILGYGWAHNCDGITLGCYLHLKIENVSIRDGFFNGIGSLNIYVSYPLQMNSCELASLGNLFFGVNSSMVHAKNTTFGFVGRSAIRMVGSGSVWSGGITNDFGVQAEGFFMGFRGDSIGAGHRFENLMIDTEGCRTSPRVAMFYLQKSMFHSSNKLIFNNVYYGSNSNRPVIYLDDDYITDWTNFPGVVDIQNSDFSGDGPIVCVRGKDWRGVVKVRRYCCSDNVLGIMPSIYPYSNIKTVHDDFYAPPNLGGWFQDAHRIDVGNPPEGGVSVWGCGRTGREGSSTPPVWTPLSFRPTRKKNNLSGNVFATFYMDASLNHPSLSSPVNLKSALFHDRFSSQILGTILNGASGPAVGQYTELFYKDMVQFGLTPILPGRTLDYNQTLKMSALMNNSSIWNAASAGQKTNNVAITIAGSAFPGDTLVRQQPYAMIIWLGNTLWEGGKYWNVICARTLPLKSGFFDGQTVTIPAGGLILRNSTRDGSWSTVAQNRILDFAFGNSITAFPTTFYIGLSKTPIAADGTGITEVTGGGYSRVAVPLSGSNFKMHDEYRSTWSNANSISFNAPTTDWGDCDWFFLSDAATGGNVWASGPLHRTLTVRSGETAPVFLPGCLQLQV